MAKIWLVPTIHPASILRDQTMQVAVVEDLRKAKRIQVDGGPTILPACYKRGEEMPEWSVYPTPGHVRWWLDCHVGHTLSLDLEVTFYDKIMCMGMWCVDCFYGYCNDAQRESNGEDLAAEQGICVPFHKKGGGAYWNKIEELKVKGWIIEMLTHPHRPRS